MGNSNSRPDTAAPENVDTGPLVVLLDGLGKIVRPNASLPSPSLQGRGGQRGFCISTFVYVENGAAVGSDPRLTVIFSKGLDKPAPSLSVYSSDKTAKLLVVCATTTGPVELQSESNFQEGEWTHVCVCIRLDQPSDQYFLDLYMNGELDCDIRIPGTPLYNDQDLVMGLGLSGYLSSTMCYAYSPRPAAIKSMASKRQPVNPPAPSIAALGDRERQMVWHPYWGSPTVGSILLKFDARVSAGSLHIAFSTKGHVRSPKYEIVVGGRENTSAVLAKGKYMVFPDDDSCNVAVVHEGEQAGVALQYGQWESHWAMLTITKPILDGIDIATVSWGKGKFAKKKALLTYSDHLPVYAKRAGIACDAAGLELRNIRVSALDGSTMKWGDDTPFFDCVTDDAMLSCGRGKVKIGPTRTTVQSFSPMPPR